MADFVATAFDYVQLALLATTSQVLVLFVPGLAIGFLMHVLADRLARLAYHGLGRAAFLGLFGWLGVPVHEIGHVIFHIIFGHRILAVRLFDPDPRSPALGYVVFAYNPRSSYQRIGKFFAGIGPILFGTVVIYIAARLLLSAEVLAALDDVVATSSLLYGEIQPSTLIGTVAEGMWAFLTSLFSVEHLLDWRWYLFLYIAFAVGSAVRLSGPDIEGAYSGFVALLAFLLLANLLTAWSGSLGELTLGLAGVFYSFFFAVMSIALVMNLLAIAVLFALGAAAAGTTSA